MKNGALAAGAAAVGAGVFGTTYRALAEDELSGSLRRAAAILRFLSALETIESDLWDHYAELGSTQLGGSKIDLPFPIKGSPEYITALEALDGDMPPVHRGQHR